MLRNLEGGCCQNHQKFLNSSVNFVPMFSNCTLNQCLLVWKVSHVLPFIRIADPILKSIIHWLRPNARVFGCKWSAEEAKRLYLLLCDLVIDKELKVFIIISCLFYLLSFLASLSSILLSHFWSYVN